MNKVGWEEGMIEIIVRTTVGLSPLQMAGFTKTELSFGVAKTWTGDVTWSLIHIKSKRMSPSCFPTYEKAVKAAELFEALGDWDAAVELYLEFGEQVPWKDSARQLVAECGGVCLHGLKPLAPPRSKRPKYLC